MKKGSANTFLLIVIVILLAIIAYLLYKKNSTESVVVNDSPVVIPEKKFPDDSELIAQAQLLYKTEVPEDNQVGVDRPVTISEKVDITSDQIPEVVISLGIGGATTDGLALFRMEKDSLVFARMKAKDGSILPVTFLSGGGGAGRYGHGYELLPQNHAFSISSYSIYGTKDDYCKTDVYQWNINTKLFEYNQALSLTEQKKIQKSCDQAKIYLEL